ncbi:putative BPI/LBP family protein At1g04970 [Actinidia eriantha]|uniref:putative BPI/LBP family protein At1g04970 n=1 Tax=Actinidia eriantha TaxID=165200 RepID=UPI00258381FF|nr:putative BPI/LBP family protein At1g04970 [Actinidia eriantha]
MGLFSNFTASNNFFLLLFLLIISSYTHVQSTEEGSISIEIFKKGLDFGKDLLIEKAISSLTPVELPEIEKAVKIPLIGTVHITLSNLVLYKVNVSSSTAEAGDTGVTIVASGAKAYMTSNWSYHYGTWLIPDITDKGVASIEIEGMEIGLTVELKNQQGTLQMSLLDCGCHVKDISIKMDGGASWLYQGVVGAFGKKIRSSVEDAISSKIKYGIRKLDSKLQSLPKAVKVDKISALNVTFVDDVVVTNSSIRLNVDGLFTARGHDVDFYHYARNSRPSMSCGGRPKMVGISIHENVLNSASLVHFKAGVMHLIVDKIPDQSFLNTSGWKLIFPQLYQQYPDDDMNLNISITSPPIVKVEQENINVASYADVTIDVLDAGEVIPVACIALVIDLSGNVEISKNNLSGSIQLNDFTMSLKWSKIGSLHMNLLKPVVESVLRAVVLPYVNLLLWRGVPLPHFHGYALHNAQIRYADSRIIACSDVTSVIRGNLDPLMIYYDHLFRESILESI